MAARNDLGADVAAIREAIQAHGVTLDEIAVQKRQNDFSSIDSILERFDTTMASLNKITGERNVAQGRVYDYLEETYNGLYGDGVPSLHGNQDPLLSVSLDNLARKEALDQILQDPVAALDSYVQIPAAEKPLFDEFLAAHKRLDGEELVLAQELESIGRQLAGLKLDYELVQTAANKLVLPIEDAETSASGGDVGDLDDFSYDGDWEDVYRPETPTAAGLEAALHKEINECSGECAVQLRIAAPRSEEDEQPRLGQRTIFRIAALAEDMRGLNVQTSETVYEKLMEYMQSRAPNELHPKPAPPLVLAPGFAKQAALLRLRRLTEPNEVVGAQEEEPLTEVQIERLLNYATGKYNPTLFRPADSSLGLGFALSRMAAISADNPDTTMGTAQGLLNNIEQAQAFKVAQNETTGDVPTLTAEDFLLLLPQSQARLSAQGIQTSNSQVVDADELTVTVLEGVGKGSIQ